MRYSSDNQNETSIEYQRAAIMDFCLKNDMEVVEEYIDEAYSATTDRRPDFQRLMRAAKKYPMWEAVLVHDMSRFCRNAGDATKYEALLTDHNIKLISVTQNFGDTNEGFLAKGITHLMNDMYSRNNAQATHGGMKATAQKAEHCGGIPPLGFDLENGKLAISEYEAEAVRMIFDMFEQNYSYTRMANVLNDAGYVTKEGKPFTKHSFSDLLHNEKYIGTYTWNQASKKNSKGEHNSHMKKPLEEQVRVVGGCPQIIAEEQFQRVQETLRSRAEGKAGSKRRYHYMLSGLKIVKCAECGSYMIGISRQSHGQRYTTYSCPKHKGNECPTKEIRTEQIDRLVACLIYRDLFLRGDHAAITQQMKCGNDTKKLQNKKRGVERAIANVIKALELSCSEALVERLNCLEQEKSALDRAIAKSKVSNVGITKENKKKLCGKFTRYLLESDDPDAKKYLVETIKEIRVSNTDVVVEMKVA